MRAARYQIPMAGMAVVAALSATPGYAAPVAPTHKVAVFTGLATSDDYAVIDPDMAELLFLLSSTVVPVLDLLGTPARAATSVKHQWTSERIGPDRIYTSTAFNSATANTGVTINGTGAYLTVGMILEPESSTGAYEQCRIESIAGPNSILLSRRHAGTGANSLVVGGAMFIVASAEKEGDDTDGDLSRPRDQYENYTQIFKKPIRISGSRQAVLTAPNVGSEIDHQEQLRTIEILKELEKAILRGRSTNTIGDDNTPRYMRGLTSFLSTNASLVYNTLFVADPMTYINDQMQACWTAGARDVNVLICGTDWSKAISATNVSRVEIAQADRTREQVVERLITDFGVITKVTTPYLRPKQLLGIAPNRVFPMPLQGRNFQREDLSKTGDNIRRQVIGEYTLEVHGEDLMFQLTDNQ